MKNRDTSTRSTPEQDGMSMNPITRATHSIMREYNTCCTSRSTLVDAFCMCTDWKPRLTNMTVIVRSSEIQECRSDDKCGTMDAGTYDTAEDTTRLYTHVE